MGELRIEKQLSCTVILQENSKYCCSRITRPDTHTHTAFPSYAGHFCFMAFLLTMSPPLLNKIMR
jgi:hypothetical protein